MTLSPQTANRVVWLLVGLVVVLVGLIVYLTVYPVPLTTESVANTNSPNSAVGGNKNFAAPASPFLEAEEIVTVSSTESENHASVNLPVQKVLFEYVEVVDSCGPHFEGECLVARSGPGTEYQAVERLRNGMVLKVGGQVVRDDRQWYKIIFDEWLRYPERVQHDWYVAAAHVKVLFDEGDQTIWEDTYSTSTGKSITVDRSEQMLYAFEGNELFLETEISTGLELTPTPRGTFTVFKKTPSRYMQGPLPNLADKQRYDLPGVPWNLYFTEGGAVIHGAYWHDSFGSAYSHGCVNVLPSTAEKLYNWADLATTVIVKD